MAIYKIQWKPSAVKELRRLDRQVAVGVPTGGTIWDSIGRGRPTVGGYHIGCIQNAI